MEAGVAQGIVAAGAYRAHPLPDGRPLARDAPAMHSAVVAARPTGANVLRFAADRR